MSEPAVQANTLAERLRSREFCYMAELVASATKKEEEVLEVAARMGVSQGKVIRDQLEQARARSSHQGFMRLAGTVRGSKDLSSRKGFSRS